MKITYLGHSGFAIEAGEYHLVSDPFITPNPLVSDKKLNQLKADYLLITHGHSDHVADVEMIAGNNPGLVLVSNYEIVTYFEQKGIKGHGMNIGGQWKFDFGNVRYVNAVHSSVLPDGTYGGNPGGFVVETTEYAFYIAGDTALTWDMKLLPMLYPRLDFAILPIGGNFTMDYKDALLAASFMECDTIIGCHYDTFEPIRIDHQEAIKYFEDNGKTLILPEIGLTFEM